MVEIPAEQSTLHSWMFTCLHQLLVRHLLLLAWHLLLVALVTTSLGKCHPHGLSI